MVGGAASSSELLRAEYTLVSGPEGSACQDTKVSQAELENERTLEAGRKLAPGRVLER